MLPYSQKCYFHEVSVAIQKFCLVYQWRILIFHQEKQCNFNISLSDYYNRVLKFEKNSWNIISNNSIFNSTVMDFQDKNKTIESNYEGLRTKCLNSLA